MGGVKRGWKMCRWWWCYVAPVCLYLAPALPSCFALYFCKDQPMLSSWNKHRKIGLNILKFREDKNCGFDGYHKNTWLEKLAYDWNSPQTNANPGAPACQPPRKMICEPRIWSGEKRSRVWLVIKIGQVNGPEGPQSDEAMVEKSSLILTRRMISEFLLKMFCYK